MNILVSVNNKYIKYLYVLMESLYQNHPDLKIHLYLLISDITSEVKEQFVSWVTDGHKQEVTICNVDPDDFTWNVGTTSAWPIEIYYRLYPHRYLPEDIDRVLYLDADIIVNDNIYSFYSMDIENHSLVACGHDEAFDGIHYPNDHTDQCAAENTIFNSGVMLMNLSYFREHVNNEFYQKINQKGYKIRFPDQGILNYFFYRSALFENTLLYNFRWHTWKGSKTCLSGSTPPPSKIIHYTCKNQPYKPWDLWFTDAEIEKFPKQNFSDTRFYIDTELNDLIGIWWRYAKMTPVYERLYYEMNVKKEWMQRFQIWKIVK